MSKQWTKESLREWIVQADVYNEKHCQALERMLLWLYSRQTTDEQDEQSVREVNGRGFSGVDAQFLSSVAEGVKQYGMMTPRQAEFVKKKLKKYAGQLLESVRQREAGDAGTAGEAQDMVGVA